jgi:hypothetical protein
MIWRRNPPIDYCFNQVGDKLMSLSVCIPAFVAVGLEMADSIAAKFLERPLGDAIGHVSASSHSDSRGQLPKSRQSLARVVA